jgi:glycosyltransferase involved in cell wall biosynthesis
VVLSPRSLVPGYNPATIVAAFERLLQSVPDAQLVVKHLGHDTPALNELADRERVHLVGYVPYEQMADYYRAADVCVSIPSSDSAPRSVWEAMACGTPCVISDLPWIHGMLEPGADALVVPIEAEALAEALRRVLTDGGLASSLASRGRARVETDHDKALSTDRLIDLYRRVAGAEGRTRTGGVASTAMP